MHAYLISAYVYLLVGIHIPVPRRGEVPASMVFAYQCATPFLSEEVRLATSLSIYLLDPVLCVKECATRIGHSLRQNFTRIPVWGTFGV